MLAPSKQEWVKYAEHLEEKSRERLTNEQQIQKYFLQTDVVYLERRIKTLEMEMEFFKWRSVNDT